MLTLKTRTRGRLVALFALLNLAEFLLFYTASFLVNTVPVLYEITVYIYRFASLLVNSAVPVAAAVAVFVGVAKKRISTHLLLALYITLTLVIYLFPYWAFYFAYQGTEITGVLILAAIYTAAYTLISALKTALLLLLMIFLSKIFAKKKRGKSPTEILEPTDVFDFGSAIVKLIFSASAALFVYNFTVELTTATIPYFEASFGVYPWQDILSMSISYLSILATLVVAHLIGFYVKNSLFTKTN